MNTVWDLLKNMKNKKLARLHDACVVVKENESGEEYELTELGINEYFEKHIDVKVEFSGLKETDSAYNAVIRLIDIKNGRWVLGCATQRKGEISNDESFSLVIQKAFENAKRKFISENIKSELIEKYIREGSFVKIPRETEKVRLFRQKPVFELVNQVG